MVKQYVITMSGLCVVSAFLVMIIERRDTFTVLAVVRYNLTDATVDAAMYVYLHMFNVS